MGPICWKGEGWGPGVLSFGRVGVEPCILFFGRLEVVAQCLVRREDGGWSRVTCSLEG